jgi:glyoxylase-like metal-dependent hydrolase (beta-lactamase superfamily II)
VVGPFAANCYLLGCSRTDEAVLLDPGGDAERVLGMLEPGKFRITRIVCTHGHIDHVAGAAALKEATGAPLQIHAADTEWLNRLPEQAATFDFGEVRVPRWTVTQTADLPRRRVRLRGAATPGRSGALSLWFPPSKCFTGDTLFAGSVGRTGPRRRFRRWSAPSARSFRQATTSARATARAASSARSGSPTPSSAKRSGAGGSSRQSRWERAPGALGRAAEMG